jgi:hypothetical protein
MRKLLLALAWCVCSLFVFAAPDPVDLGENLSYVRLRALGEDSAAISTVTSDALIIDLRRVEVTDEAIESFSAAVSQRAARTQLFILVGPDTPSVLAKNLASLPARVLTLGTANSRPTPKVIVETDSKTEQAAYDAFETGTSIDALINGKIVKERYDEATLVQEFKHGAISLVPTETAKNDAKDSESASGDSAPPTDRVLQRAVHVHRTILALKK